MDDLQSKLMYKKSDADDWTKVDDKALRKKLQNRLAKRKSRTGGGKAKRTNEPVLPGPSWDGSQTADPKIIDALPMNTANDSLTTDSPETPDAGIGSINDESQSSTSVPGLSEHYFISLTQYSLLRALIQNATFLSLDFHFLMDDHSVSPWTVSSPYPTLYPNDLSPTNLQICTPHHPYLDIIALPAFRDNVLLACLDEDVEDQLCHDLHIGSFTVWGSQPWNAFAWEVGQEFATSWWWLLDDGLIRATNFWRGERGESPLVLPDSSKCIIEELF